MAGDESKPRPVRGHRGPRGGTTTRTASGMVKKNFWIPPEDAERLRRLAYQEHISEAELIRQGLRLLFAEWEE